MKAKIIRYLPVFSIVTMALLFSFAAAQAPAPAERPITLRLDNTPLPEALAAIQDASGLNLAFAHELVDGAAPVTLDVTGEPAGEVLYRVLRERGLVPIHTSETMAAVVDDASDIGAVKIAGRAIRTFVRLAHKLDKAEQHGDEVRVPGWTHDDDDALASAVIDFAAAVYYREVAGRKSTAELLEEFQRLLNLPDHDLHVAFLIALANWRGSFPDDEAERSQIITLMRSKFNDTDPCVRASAFMGAGFFSERMPTPLSDILELSADDPAPEVRFVSAVVLSAGMVPKHPQVAVIKQKLLNDPHAGVRTAAGFAAWEKDWRNIAEDKADLFCAKAAADLAGESNPIAKAISAITAMAYARDHLPNLLAHLSKIEPEADPWLKMIVDISSPIFLADYNQRRAHAEMEAGAVPVERGPAPGPKEMLDRFMQLALSGKRSHQVIALGMTRLTVASVMMGANEPQPDLTPLAALADSPELPARLLGTLGVVASRQATPEFCLRLLNSNRRIDRMLGVVAPSFPGGPPPSDEVKSALKQSAMSGDFAESALALSMFRNTMDAEELLALFSEQAKRSPKSVHTRLMLQNFAQARMSNEQVLMLFESVLDTGELSLQKTFLTRLNWWQYRENEPLVLAVIYDSHEDLLLEIFKSGYDYRLNELKNVLREKDYAVQAVCQRLRESMKDAPETARKAVMTMAAYVDDDMLWHRQKDHSELLASISDVLVYCTRAGAPDADLVAGGELLASHISRYPMPDDKPMPEIIQQATLDLLASAGRNEQLTSAVAKVAAAMHQTRFRWHRRGNEDPELDTALRQAHDVINAKGSMTDRVMIWCSMANVSNTQETAIRELEKHFCAGEIPDEKLRDTLNAFTRAPELVSAAAAERLLKIVSDRSIRDVQLRWIAASLLVYVPGQMPALLDVLEKSMETDKQTDMLSSVAYALRSSRRIQPDRFEPAVLKRAYELGKRVTTDTEFGMGVSAGAVRLSAFSGAPEAEQLLFDFITDTGGNEIIRQTSAEVLLQAFPQTELLVKLLGVYDTLTNQVWCALAQSAANSNNIKGAQELAVRILKDETLQAYEKINLLHNIRFEEPTAELNAVIEKLSEHPEIGNAAGYAAQQIKQAQEEKRRREEHEKRLEEQRRQREEAGR